MAENTSSTQAPPALSVRLFYGQQLPWFHKDKDDPSVWSSMDMNTIVAVCNLVLGMKFNFKDPVVQADGTTKSSATVTISDQNMIVDLSIASGTGGGSANIVPMKVVSYTTTNEYLTALAGVFTGDDVFVTSGSAVNVALPWELRPGDPGSVSPPYEAGDIIYVLSTGAGQNGVVVGGTELTLMDLGLGRTWSQGSMNYRGTYNSLLAYNKYDVVRVQSGASQGVWICVVGNQTAGQDPVWPEPGTNIWELLTFGVQATSVCESGSSKTIYFNATPPM